jgi:predicted PurR-regulated permease PerM
LIGRGKPLDQSRSKSAAAPPRPILSISTQSSNSTGLLRLVAVCIAILTVLAVGFTAWAAREFLIPIAVGLLLSVMLAPIARMLERRGASPTAAAAAVTLSLVAGIGLLVWALTPEVALISRTLPETSAAIAAKVDAIREAVQPFERARQQLQEVTQEVGAAPKSSPIVVQQASPLTLALTQIAQAGAQTVATFILVFFTLAQRRRMKTIVIAMARGHSTRKRIIQMFRDIKQRISTYLLSIAATSLGLGIASGIALSLLGFPNPIMWGAAVALLNPVPYAGPLVVQLGALFVGVIIYPTLLMALAPAFVLMALNFIEGQFVTPLVVAQRVVLNPLSVFLAIVFGGWIWGVIGAVLAVPGLIVAASVLQHWWSPCATTGRGEARTGDELRLFDERRSALSARRPAPVDAVSIDKRHIDRA